MNFGVLNFVVEYFYNLLFNSKIEYFDYDMILIMICVYGCNVFYFYIIIKVWMS